MQRDSEWSFECQYSLRHEVWRAGWPIICVLFVGAGRLLWGNASRSHLEGVILALPVALLISLLWYLFVRRRAPKRLRVSPEAIFIGMPGGKVISSPVSDSTIRQRFGKIYLVTRAGRFRLFPDLENLQLLEELVSSAVTFHPTNGSAPEPESNEGPDKDD